ncbi:MAG TPA: molybdopterin cofactor-binding domain-containing protein, partial [Gemmatimonadales bacterium]|nr:molybdopterin cofactor-binding domain-containing protein [Gemmatimonadales bacterium]
MRPDLDEMIVPEGWGFATTMDRREFVTLTSVGLLVMCGVKPTANMVQAKWNPAGMQEAASDWNAFLHIGADGRVTVLVGKIEMGQGVMTSLPQLAAEELNVPLASVDVVLGDTDLCPFDRGTFGSLSVRSLGPVLRAAAAEARAVLTQMAAERLQVDIADLEVKDG